MTALVLVYNITVSGFTLTLPINTGTIDSIDWGDGTIDTSTSHTYATSNTYTVTILGTGITTFNYSSGTGQEYLTECTSFGDIGLTNLTFMFYSATNLTVVPSTLPTIVTNMRSMFYVATSFNQDISGWNTTNVTSMNSTFYQATAFNQNISSWNTANVTNMDEMFRGATSFNQDISSWNIANVQSINSMFNGATAFNQDIGTWTTTSVTNMGGMFSDATAFNQNISGWNTANVQYMVYMFYGAAEFNQDIGTWNVSNVTDMTDMLSNSGLSITNYNALLNGWAALPSLQPSVPLGAAGLQYTPSGAVGRNTLTSAPNDWVITGDTLLSPLILVYNITVPSFTLTLPINTGTVTSIDWGDGTTPDTSTSHTYATSNTYTVSILGTGITSFNYSDLGTTGREYLTECTSFGDIGLTDLTRMFFYATNLTVVPSSLPSTVTNMSAMFQITSSFNQNIGTWNTANVTNMSSMFQDTTSFNQNIGTWDTSNVTDMSLMFYYATSFNQDISGWNTANVTLMNSMFNGATAFNQNIGTWNTSIVTGMSFMFRNAVAFNQNIGSWDVSNVTSMNSMLDNTSLSITNYNALLNGWAAQTVQPSVTLGAGGLQYTPSGAVGRNTLTSAPNDWVITGDSPLPPLILVYNITVPSFTLTLPITTGIIDSIDWGDGTTPDTSTSHTYATSNTYTVTILGTGITTFNYSSGTGQEYLTECTSFGDIGLTNLSYMFYNATNLTVVPSSLPLNVTNTNSMFSGATAFNQNIGGWNTANVTSMIAMFQVATSFNQDIGIWNTANVTNMSIMFEGATSFNQNIGSWDVSNVTDMTDMLSNSGLSITNYNALLNGWAAQTVQNGVALGAAGLTYSSSGQSSRNTLTSPPNNWIITGDTFLPPPVCFKEGSKILTDTGYKAIERLRKGDLVKTLKHGYKSIVMIGKRDIYNPAQKDRIKDQLYKCSQDKYPELTEDLIITGCHSILVDNLVTHKKIKEIKEVLGGIYFTDDKLRMPACLDEKTSVYEVKGNFTIYHIALENDDYYMNYGVYANGLLVETCSKRYLKELSNMVLF